MTPEGADVDRWFRPWLRRARPRLRLLCIPYAGGQANLFASWAGEFSEEVEVRALQLPGRGVRFSEPLCDDLARLLEAIEPHAAALTRISYAFFGHSMGAILAFELTRRLRRLGLPPPRHLFVSACRPPERFRGEPRPALSDAALVERMRSLGGTPPEIFENQELLDLLLPVVSADMRALDSWVSPLEPPLDAPITALSGRDDALVPPAEMSGWRAHTMGPFEECSFAGGHFYLRTAQHELGAQLRRSLGTAAPSKAQ